MGLVERYEYTAAYPAGCLPEAGKLTKAISGAYGSTWKEFLAHDRA